MVCSGKDTTIVWSSLSSCAETKVCSLALFVFVSFAAIHCRPQPRHQISKAMGIRSNITVLFLAGIVFSEAEKI